MDCIIRKCIYLILYNFAKKKKNLETGYFMLLRTAAESTKVPNARADSLSY